MKKYITVRSQFGHEILALNIAKGLSLGVVILPQKENKEEFDKESAKIYNNLSFLYNRIEKVDFEERHNYEANSWDFVSDLCQQKMPNWVWEKFAKTHLNPNKDKIEFLPIYKGLMEKHNVLFVPQKLKSDEKCGITAEQQCLPLELFDFLKNRPEQLVLGQHFHKINDIDDINKLAHQFSLYVPGMTENHNVLGIRGVNHEQYYNMYKNIDASIGVAGTHTWLMLALFPEKPQIILYNKKGAENWSSIEKALQEQGHHIYMIGFDADTDITELENEIITKYNLIVPRHKVNTAFFNKTENSL